MEIAENPAIEAIVPTQKKNKNNNWAQICDSSVKL